MSLVFYRFDEIVGMGLMVDFFQFALDAKVVAKELTPSK